MPSEVMNPKWYTDPEWMELHTQLESYSVDKHVFFTDAGHVYRKGWEWTHCLYGLTKHGCIQLGAKALGVGAGREPVIFWLADHIASVVATDLYGNDTWSSSGGKEASAQVLTDASPYCPRQVDLSKVKFQYADGTDLPFADEQFDFCWSLSSIEHFGGHEQSAKAMREMARVTKRGGMVCVATEFLLLPEYRHEEFFTKAELETYIINASSGLRLTGQMSWDLPPQEYLIDSITVPQNPHRRRRHVVLNDGDMQWTSVMVFLRKL